MIKFLCSNIYHQKFISKMNGKANIIKLYMTLQNISIHKARTIVTVLKFFHKLHFLYRGVLPHANKKNILSLFFITDMNSNKQITELTRNFTYNTNFNSM